jgi:sugar lactone lactonase YvrE
MKSVLKFYMLFSLSLWLINPTVKAQDKNIFQSDKLVKKWETPQTLQIPESVYFDEVNNVIFVSNINGKPTEKDGDGYISKLLPDGTISATKWITGLNAPKGMGVYNGKLFVTDIDRIAEIDIKGSKIIRFYEFPEAKFLNDIDIDSKGAVYISDMMSARIYRIYEGKTEVWLDDEMLSNPNGLYVEGNELLIGCKKIVRADISTGKFTEWLNGTGGIDGLEATGDGRYLFSDWQGNVYLVNKDKSIEKVLDTTPAGINAADIEFIPSKKLLLVPTFGDNRVMAYELR